MTAAVIVAAGRGLRLGGERPKALRALAGLPMFRYSLREALACPEIRRVIVVVPGEELETLSALHTADSGRVQFVAGGSTRQQSVLRALEAAGRDVDWVAVHDAARPLVTSELFTAVITLAMKRGGALAAHPATDTIRRLSPDGALSSFHRAELWHAETPQVFPRLALERALSRCEQEGLNVTDEAEAMERDGCTPALYHNTSANPKIATDTDWQMVELLLRSRPVTFP